nr:FAD-dependent oxidoreductase [Corynebacterium gottingense]
MIDVRKHFRGVEVLDGGKRVRVQSGSTVRQVNAHLAPYGRKLGPIRHLRARRRSVE